MSIFLKERMKPMKKRWIMNLLLVSLLLMLLSPAAGAVAASGSCGEGLTWKLENYTLTVTGSGEMEDGCPWEDYKTKIEHVVLSGGVTKVGKENFSVVLHSTRNLSVLTSALSSKAPLAI